GDELLLLSCGRTVIRQDLHPLPRCDVAQVAGRAAGALDIRAFQDQSCHGSPSQFGSPAARARFSSEIRPLVAFTLWTLSARLRFRSSRSISIASAMIPMTISDIGCMYRPPARRWAARCGWTA